MISKIKELKEYVSHSTGALLLVSVHSDRVEKMNSINAFELPLNKAQRQLPGVNVCHQSVKRGVIHKQQMCQWKLYDFTPYKEAVFTYCKSKLMIEHQMFTDYPPPSSF